MFWIFFVLLIVSTGDCILIGKIDNNILIGNISKSLWNITQNQCICEMIDSNGIISTLNYFSTNQTCQLFYTNFTSILIEFSLNSSLIFMNQSAIFIAQNQITSATTSAATTTTVCTQPSWSQTATTIFGSQAGTSGSNFTLLSAPIGMYYDGLNNMLTVADYGNHRILRFPITNPPSVATVIAGGDGAGCNISQFRSVDGIGVDNSGRFYVADYDCGQVVRFPSNSNSTTSGTLLGSIAQAALISVNQLTGDIYVVSHTDNAVYKFVEGSGSPVVAAGGNGNGNASNQLNGPNGVYYDYLYTNALYVTEIGNSRVMKYPSGSTNATYGTVVAGGNGAGSGANQLNNPRSIVVDSTRTLYISDASHNRIQRWLKNATSGTTVVGGTSGTASNQLNFPETVLFDKYVCTLSSRSSWSQNATTIFGSQAGGTYGSTLSLLDIPIGMYYDQANNRLIVADFGNQRILQFSINNPPSVATVIAESNGQGCNMNQFNGPVGVVLDSSGQLYVADYVCNQVVRFPSGSNSATTATLLGSVAQAALLSLDQLTNDIYVAGSNDNAVYNFVGGSGSPVVAAGGNGNGNALNQLSGPNGVYYDYLYTDSLYVTDSGNNRVINFPSGSTIATYGTVVAGGNGAGSGANQLNNPRSIVVDSTRTLYISDASNNRIQRWLSNATSGTTVVGGTTGTASNQLNWPEQILFDKYGNLLVVDRGNNRIQMFNLTTC
ncbi:unnamed protein product [Adineta steineri]|uniref:NHL repeat containing protein-like protein n=1 Tax=Adineta steineri TaxID=433720 RepID=A0A813YUX0_9BILA|nr:unnamed protein product [Adineta steineri]CAF1164994.1 unnamed protein product [Adineta steineri]